KTVKVTDTLPSGYGTNVLVTPGSGASCTQTATAPVKVTCTIATLTSGSSIAISIQATPTVTGTYKNTASITSSVTYDPFASNNKHSVTTTVTGSSGATAEVGTPAQLNSPEPDVD